MIRDTSAQDIQRKPTAVSVRTLRWALPGLALIIAAAAAYPALGRWAGVDLTVASERLRFDAVQRGDFIRDISVQGQIVAAVRPVLYSPEKGRVSLLVRAGDKVSQGQLLARIDSPELDNRYRQELSTLESLRAEVQRQEIQTRSERLAGKRQVDLRQMELVAAQRELRRAKIAFERNAISLQDYEKASDDNDKAVLQLTNVKAAQALDSERLELELNILKHRFQRQQLLVDDLERQVQALSIASPVSGMVGNLEVEEKAVVSRYQAILSVVDLSAYEVEAGVPENYVDELAIGMSVEIQYNGAAYNGELAAISPEVQAGRVQTRIRFTDNKPEQLRQNQRVSSRIVIEEKTSVLSVRRGNFLQTGSGSSVYRMEDGMAVKVPITIGAASSSRVEILSGVEEGDRLVIAGANVFDNQNSVFISE